MNYKTIIGLETHIELATEQKMFCGCKNSYFGSHPNRNVCPVCLGLPGALPVPNYQAIKWTVLIGLALNCKINLNSYFERKHYFYPDLPKGYQITQYQKPLCENGFLIIGSRKIRINRVHLEEDTGKLIHGEQFNDSGSYIDFNRAGVPLVEIVTEPDVRTPDEAVAYLKQLQLIIQYLEVSNCDLEKGSMRCEPNISVIGKDSWDKYHKLPDYKVEIKNINSFRFVKRAIEYEIKRQVLIQKQGQKPIQETRRYIESSYKTESMRTKEVAQDYRYFPEPDIPPLKFDKKQIDQIKKQLISLPSPEKRRSYLTQRLFLDKETASKLTEDKRLGDRYLALIKQAPKLNKQKLANLIINKKVNLALSNSAIISEAKSKLSQKTIAPAVLKQTIETVLENNQKAVSDYQRGKQTAIQFLLGQCLKILGRQIEINQLKSMLLKELSLKQ